MHPARNGVPQRRTVINILNYETQKMYRFGGHWTEHPMRMRPGAPPRRRTLPLVPKLEPIEGSETWSSRMNVRTAR